MENCNGKNNLNQKQVTDINNNPNFKESGYLIRTKIKQKKSKIILRKKKELKQLNKFSNKTINFSAREILNTPKNISEIKINFDEIQHIPNKKTPDNNNLVKINTFLKNKIQKFYIFLRCIISLINFFSFYSNMNKENILLKLTEVTLKVKGTGNIKILSDSFFQKYNQCEVYINDILQNITKNEYYFTDFELTKLEESTNKYNFNNSEIGNSNNIKNEDYIDKSEIDNSDILLYKIYFETTELDSVQLSSTEYYLNNQHSINSDILKNTKNFLKESDSIIFDDEEIENSDIYFYNYSRLKSSNSSRNKNNLEKEKDIYEIKIIWNNNDTNITTTDNMFFNCEKIIGIDLSNFNSSQVNNTSRMFYGCTSLSSLNLSNFDTSNVKTMESMFYDCSSLSILDLNNFDVSQVTSMYQMFHNCSSLISLNLSNFDTRNVLSMFKLFSECSSLIFLDISNFDTTKVINMAFLFYKCSQLESLNLLNFNTSQVTNMENMFDSCSLLTSLDLSNFNTSNVTKMNYMFSTCKNLTSLNLSNFDTSKVTIMSGMFYNCYNITSLDLTNFDTSQVKSMYCMFYQCSYLSSLILSNFNTSQVYTMNRMFTHCKSLSSLNISNFDTSRVNDTSLMFYNCSSLTSLDLSNFDTSQFKNIYQMFYLCRNLTYLNLSNFNTSQVIDMGYFLSYCYGLESINLSNFDTSRVTNMACMFCGCRFSSLKLDNFDTSKVNNMYNMFNGCYNLKSLDLSNFNVTLINNIKGMFYGCSNLVSLDLSNFKMPLLNDTSNLFFGCTKLIYLNISNFDTSQVKNFSSMFSKCSALYILDISKFNTSQGVDMSYMFSESKNLSSLDLSNFDTSRVTNMKYMFNGCTKLNSLNLDNFITTKVNNMSYMFSGCNKINILYLSNFDTSNVNNMSGMFSECTSLISLDLYNFKTPKVNDISFMFFGCSNLTSINLSNFNTTKTNNMSYMFSGCLSLNSLDLSNFNMKNVMNMSYMFNECRSLSSLDLSNFRTSKVSNMSHMFYNCSSLSSLDLSNFQTNQINDMSFMFYNCSSLTSVNLSDFNTLKVNDISYMFYNCSKMISLNLSKLDTSKANNMSNMFYGCSTLTLLDLSNFKASKVKDMSNMFYDCSNLEYINLKNSNISSKININNIFLFTYENLMVCIQNENNKFLNILEGKIIFYCDDNHLNTYYCYIKNFTLDNIYMCDVCQNDFIFNETENNYSYPYSYINCFEPRIIVCYNSCKTCEIEGNETINNCIECKDEFIYEFNITNSKYKNCFINNPIIPTTATIQMETTHIINYSPQTSQLINYKVESTIIQVENKTEKINNIISGLINEFNQTETDSGKDKTIVDDEKVIIFTSTENQKNNEEDRYITMDLGECEYKLKNHYHIPMNNSLFILQIISEEKGMKIPKMEYEVYYPLNNTKDLTKLNLTLCEGTKIEISISIDINGTLDLSIFDPNSKYYNDICTISTSDTGTDIPLKDRRNEFIKNNLSLCEENCELVDYNKETKKVKCSCDMKSSINSNYDTKFNKDDFLKSFTDVKNILNLNIMKCFNVAFNIKNLKKNYGFFIMLSILILFFITLSIFTSVSFKKLKKEIKRIIRAIKINEMTTIKRKSINKPDIVIKKVKKKLNQILIDKNNKKYKKGYHKRKFKIIQNDKDKSNYRIYPNEKEIIDADNKKVKKILKKKTFELNSLDYEEGRKIDHRNYCEYYGSLLKYNHPLIFSFALYNDYNSKIIKLFLFFFSFCLDLSINALFFTDDAMHKIHQDKGTFDFLYQIPQILYSVFISRVIDGLIRKLALSQDKIVDLKQVKRITKKQKKILFGILKMKFTIYFILTFIIIMLFFYYITCFCGIYVNTQIHLIKDSLISLGTSMLLPFVFYSIPGYFRIAALRAEKPNQKMLYIFSGILEYILV